ncbi:hypothetical protein E6P09_07565 [Haloferax mediterranei ATCC 33500]|nr:hypothetical protein [Haloferax mediterranei]MDX5988716.1 hypothetical protein [Haloferax mediterranei ATCC 33500]QCQ75125.1 hypothetical protein E6P09_07565 [Haloferax mediterranei ATCC 33500]
MAVETTLLLYKDKSKFLGGFEEGEARVKKEVERYASKSLNLASITFAAIALVLGLDTPPQGALLMFSYGFVLLVISFKVEVFGAVRRIWWDLQQRIFNYGILSIILGIYLYIHQSRIQYEFVADLLVVAVVSIHIYEYYFDYKNH